MDLPTVLIGIAVCLLSALLIYIISAYSMREKTFEEVIAEQKRQEELEEERERTKKKAQRERLSKRYGHYKKKEKGKGKNAVQMEEKEATPVEEEYEPEVIEPEVIEPEIIEKVEVQKSNVAPKKKSKKPKNEDKKIIEEVIESQMIQQVEAPVSQSRKEVKPEKAVEEMMVKEKVVETHSKPQKKHGDNRESKHDKNAESQESVIRKKEAKIEKMILEEQQKQAYSVPVSSLEQKSPKRSPVAEKQYVMNSIKSINLTEPEAQSIIDVLLNKQGGAVSSQEWNKKTQKGDPVAQLRKQLEDKEKTLQEEQNMAMAAGAKVKEMGQELTKEKVRFSNTQKQYQEKLNIHNQEISALHAKMGSTHEQHMIESSQLKARIQQLEGQVGEKGRLHKLIEENKMLKDNLSKIQADPVDKTEVNNLRQKVQILEQEMSKNVVKLSSAEKSKGSLELQIKQYEDKVQQLEESQNDSDGVSAKKVDEFVVQLRKEEAKNASLNKDLSNVTKELRSAEGEIASWKSKLKELEKKLSETDDTYRSLDSKLKDTQKAKTDLEGNVHTLEKQLNNTKDKGRDMEKEIKEFDRIKSELTCNIQNLEKQLQCANELTLDLERENQTLKTDTVKVVKETALQSAPPSATHNGDLTDTEKIKLEEHKQLMTEKLNEINKLVEELDNKKSESNAFEKQVTDLTSQIQKKEKLYMSLEDRLKSVESTKSELEKKFVSLRSDVDSQKGQSDNLEEELEVQRKKNNELREKNWKAMEALEKSEKSVSEKVQGAVKTEQDKTVHRLSDVESTTKSCMLRLFPDVHPKDTEYQKWLSTFEKDASSHLKSLSSDTKQIKEKENKSEKASEENNKLQQQVQQYRNVLSETEEKLKQLQMSVESEESKWQDKIQYKDTELNSAKKEISVLKEELKTHTGSSEMEEKVEELQSEVKKVECEKQEEVTKFETRVKELESRLQAKECSIITVEKSSYEKEQELIVIKSELEKVKRSGDDLEALRKLIAQLQKDLEEEKKKSKDLASTNVKLNGIIKTGQATLKQEQDTIDKLQNQLESISNSSNSSQTLENQELKVKLKELSSQLEGEMQKSHQLTEQLVQFGVKVSRKKGDGTSV